MSTETIKDFVIPIIAIIATLLGTYLGFILNNCNEKKLKKERFETAIIVLNSELQNVSDNLDTFIKTKNKTKDQIIPSHSIFNGSKNFEGYKHDLAYNPELLIDLQKIYDKLVKYDNVCNMLSENLPSLNKIKDKISKEELSNQEYNVYKNIVFFENSPMSDLKNDVDNVLKLLSKEITNE